MMFGNNGKNDDVIRLAKGLVVSHHQPVDIAYIMAYRYVFGKYTDRMPSSAENKIWRCQDYRPISPDEYSIIKAVYESNRAKPVNF